MDIQSFYSWKDTSDDEAASAMKKFRKLLASGKNAAFVIRKGALSYDEKMNYGNENRMTRGEHYSPYCKISGEDPIISTTGKASRELFEIRAENKQKPSI